MKNVLCYQVSEYDCGPTSLMNALRFLYERDQITPELIKAVGNYTLDNYNDKGEMGRHGTSREVMTFLAYWFNQYGKSHDFPIYAKHLSGPEVCIKEDSEIVKCLNSGGVTVARVVLEEDPHYILLTGMTEDGRVKVFDPYDLSDRDVIEIKGTEVTHEEPKVMNRIVDAEIFNTTDEPSYSLGAQELREAMMIFAAREFPWTE